MAEVNQNAEIYQGESAKIEVPVLGPDSQPLDLTGIDVHYRVARSAQSATLLSIDRPDITSAVDVATIPLTAAQTKTLPAKSLYHELYMIDGTDRTVLMTGLLTVSPAQASQHAA